MRIKQTDRILSYMRTFGSITPLEALSDLGVMRLASRISDIKKQGYIIKSETVKSFNRYGEKIHFSKYSLGGKVK